MKPFTPALEGIVTELTQALSQDAMSSLDFNAVIYRGLVELRMLSGNPAEDKEELVAYARTISFKVSQKVKLRKIFGLSTDYVGAKDVEYSDGIKEDIAGYEQLTSDLRTHLARTPNIGSLSPSHRRMMIDHFFDGRDDVTESNRKYLTDVTLGMYALIAAATNDNT